MKKLCSMVDFVLEQEKPTYLQSEEFEDVYYKIHNYAQFLKQKPELWMFVPCDENGNVLEEPIGSIGGVEWYAETYQQAKERCLFEGFKIVGTGDWTDDLIFEIVDSNDNYFFYDPDDKTLHDSGDLFVYDVEDLIKYNLTLTQTAIKTLGL